jgi:hypothetical protein
MGNRWGQPVEELAARFSRIRRPQKIGTPYPSVLVEASSDRQIHQLQLNAKITSLP